jgi:hypothetical protein
MQKTKTRTWNPSLPEPGPIPIGLTGIFSVELDYGGPVDFSHDGHSSKGQWYAGYGLKVIATIDNTKHGRLLHVSVTASDAGEVPPWEAMIAIKRALYPPDVAAMMVMPEEEVYVNLHSGCLHIWQLPEKWDIA